MEKELHYLSKRLEKPGTPFAAIVGGSKLSTKFDLIESLLEKVNILILGGGLIFTFYKAQNLSVGFSLVEDHMIGSALSLISKAKKKGVSIMLPDDVVIADKFSPAAKSEVVPSAKIPDNRMGLDIGKRAISSFEELETAKTILWNGPMGVSEYDKFATGTKAIAKKLAELSGTGVETIVVGSDTVAAVRKMRLADKMSHISMGGFASLEFLEGVPLPGVMALDDDTIG
ncbi:phosphoglycerate kinase 3, cytosolic-like isoform X2 [Nicotiana tabacum]|uniref:Phosphoglycerate kinase 3, cytosolic-like isoform X2 n=2 Tax=Nicotiana tabacum TaxID=4097 RepID=A0AC58T7C1_TOBAC|nr:PREDICTED: phosphoglycerate kinase, cytosolic-like [Nicotiana tabacum]